MGQPVSIFLVDDHTVVRSGLKALIEKIGDFKITGEFDNGKELVKGWPFITLPDLIILDLAMPVMDGPATMQWMQEQDKKVPVLVLTLEHDEETIVRLFKMGVRGYIEKNCTAAVLKRAIDDIIQFGYYHSELLVKALAAAERSKETATDKIRKQISARELEFLKLVCDEEEYTYKMIAEKMKVHPSTVDGYRESLFFKLNIRTKSGLILFAFRHGII
jgi:two-component system, NarL family, invasion response regulator UvrY